MNRVTASVTACGLALVLAQGCGSSGTPSAHTSSANATSTSAPASSGAPNALAGEAQSAATGDIPDNQVFLTYRSASPRYTMLYPEGWALKGGGPDVTISDKNNIVHVVISSGGPPSAQGLATELSALKRSSPSLTFSSPAPVGLKPGRALKATYSTLSAPNPVTGKSVLLIVDRYELSSAGRRATVDLGTPKGVDNVDAYRKMINSFTWQ